MTFRSPTNKQPRRKPAVNAAATVTLVPGAVFVPLRPRLPRAAGLQLTVSQQLVCDRILNVFEPDRVQGDCANISRFHDGPGKIRQITHGAKQTTKYGNLRELVAMSVAAGGIHSAELAPYVAKIGATALVEDQTFMSLLPDSGRNEPVMRFLNIAFGLRLGAPGGLADGALGLAHRLVRRAFDLVAGSAAHRTLP